MESLLAGDTDDLICRAPQAFNPTLSFFRLRYLPLTKHLRAVLQAGSKLSARADTALTESTLSFGIL